MLNTNDYEPLQELCDIACIYCKDTRHCFIEYLPENSQEGYHCWIECCRCTARGPVCDDKVTAITSFINKEIVETYRDKEYADLFPEFIFTEKDHIAETLKLMEEIDDDYITDSDSVITEVNNEFTLELAIKDTSGLGKSATFIRSVANWMIEILENDEPAVLEVAFKSIKNKFGKIVINE